MGFDVEAAIKDRQKQSAQQKGFDVDAALQARKSPAVAVTEDYFGADFDAEKTASLGLRYDLARGDTLEEKKLRLQQKYPEGEIRVFEPGMFGNNQEVLMYRESPQAQWGMVDPPGFRTTTEGEPAGWKITKWDWGDVVEAMAPSAEALAGETAATVLSGGKTVPAVILRQALGAIFGEGVEQAGQTAAGVQSQSLSEQGIEAGVEGGASLIGGLAMSPVSALNNVLRGRGALRVGEEGMERIRAANELSPELGERMTPGMTSDNPAVRVSERQAAALLPGLQRAYREAIVALDKAILPETTKSAAATAATSVVARLQQFGRKLVSKVRNAPVAASKGGTAIQEGIEEYDLVAKAINNRLYRVARSIEEPEFDFQKLADVSNDLSKGKIGKVNPKVAQAIEDLQKIEGPVELSDGEIISVTDQLRNVRTGLFDLKNVPAGEFGDQGRAQASRLYNAITDTLKTPTNDNPAFQQAWEAANKAAKERFEVLGKAAIIDAAKSETPAKLAQGLGRPYEVDRILTIRNTIPPDKFREFQKSFVSDVLSDPKNAFQRIEAFDQPTLDAILPRSQQGALKAVAKDLSRVTSIGADEILERQVTNLNFIRTMVNSADPRAAQTLIRSINDVRDVATRDSLRAAIVQYAWDGVIESSKTTLKVNDKLLEANVKKLRENGLWRVLNPEQRAAVNNARKVSKAFQNVVDAGVSIQAAEAVQGVKQLNPSALMVFASNYLVERFYLSATGRKLLLGQGIPNSNGRYLRLLGGALTRMSTPEDITKLEE